MLHGWIEPDTQMPRSRTFWIVVGTIVASQLVAFWLLCSHQVRKAEARNAEVQMARMALADCLQYIPGSTIASCVARLAPLQPGGGMPANAMVSGALQSATPVNFSYR